MPSKDPDTKRAVDKRYRQRHAERIHARERAYRLAHQTERNARSRAYHVAHREDILAYQHAYRLEHLEARKTKNKQYRLANREKINAQRKQFRLENRERLQEKSRKYYAANPERFLENNRRLRVETPELTSHWHNLRRARKQAAPRNDLTIAQWREIKAHYGHRCVYCERKMTPLTMDHLVPLSRGGSHTASNVVPACQSCNSRKRQGPPLKPVQPLLLTISPALKKRKAS